MDALENEFPLDPEIVYLNHAAVAPWPARTAAAVEAFARENIHQGARDYPRWLEREQRLREQLRDLVGAESIDDIALLKNTSEGLSVIAAGLPWKAGDNVVITDQEFPSNRIPWQALGRQDVETREVSLTGPEPEENLVNAMDSRTRLLSVSSVQYGTGLRLDLKRLGKACEERGVLFCVDAIQSLGAHPVDAGAVGAHFVVADGHKWMLGPEGLAVFYCAPGVREQLALQQYGWHMVEHAGDFDRRDWQPATSARRFECGSPNLLGAHALSASLSLLLETGLDTVEAEIRQRLDYLMEPLRNRHGAEIITPEAAGRRAGIVTFRLPREAPEATWKRLREGGVICALRGGGVRLSPHYYTPWTHLERALALLEG